MLWDFWLSFKIRITYKVNGFIYGLKRIPFIKKCLPSSIYSNETLKILGQIYAILREITMMFLGKILYVILLFMIPISLYEGNRELIFVQAFLFMTIIGAFFNTELFEATKDKYYAIIIMRMSAKNYVLSNYLYFLVKTVIPMLIMTIIAGVVMGIRWYIVLVMPLYQIATKLFVTHLKLKKYEKTRKIVYNKGMGQKMDWAIMVISLSIAYIAPVVGLILPLIISLPIMIFVIVCGVWSFSKVIKFSLYTEMCKKLLHQDNIVFNINVAQNQAKSAHNWLDDKNVLNDTSDLKGYKYLNDIFVKRHKRILTSLATKISIVTSVVIILVVVLMFQLPEIKIVINKNIIKVLPTFLLVMYMLNGGEKIANILFMNCDHSMLNYSFFRRPKDILELFAIRLKTMIKINLRSAFFIAIGLPIILLASGGTDNSIEYIALFVSIIAMSIFFSVHYLTIYYLLQPYNSDLEVKNPLYKFITAFTYFISYIFVQVQVNAMIFSLILIGFVVVYVILALILVYYKAPKTFRIG